VEATLLLNFQKDRELPILVFGFLGEKEFAKVLNLKSHHLTGKIFFLAFLLSKKKSLRILSGKINGILFLPLIQKKEEKSTNLDTTNLY